MFHRLTILAAMAAFLFCASTEMADAKRRPETCGDNFIDSGEQCDGTDLGAATCGDFGYTAGDVTCGTSCKLDSSGCYCAATDTCGDGVIDADEECDQGNLVGIA